MHFDLNCEKINVTQMRIIVQSLTKNFFQQQLRVPNQHIHCQVSRRDLVGKLMKELSVKYPPQLSLSSFDINFEGEDGYDAGGL
jgi:gamma-glutamyl:cysteine ligase YbdK (ATP-grasp superfamily)